jgi:hypothetical protein
MSLHRLFVLALVGTALAPATFLAAPPPQRDPVVIDRAALMRDVTTLASDAMEGREVGTPGGLRAREYIETRFHESGLRAFEGGYVRAFPLPSRSERHTIESGANVVGYIGGTERPDRFVVVSAHYDHVGVRNGQVFNGANDNASGTAALFAIAAHFTRVAPATSLIVVAFDGEETGLWGSRAFLRALPVGRADIVVNLNIDMIARDASRRLYVTGTSRQPALRPVVERAAVSPGLTLVFGHDDPRRPADDWTQDSDQWTFIEAGIPALYFGVEDYAHHHKVTDDAETVMEDFFAAAVETLIRVVDEFAR